MKFFIKLFSLSFIFSALISLAYAHQSNEIMIINHFNKPLSFEININPDVLPNLPTNFSLYPHDYTLSKVLDKHHEAYIKVKDQNDEHAFWGVQIIHNQLKFYGYLDKGIAYSWGNNTIIFCTPVDYRKNNACV